MSEKVVIDKKVLVEMLATMYRMGAEMAIEVNRTVITKELSERTAEKMMGALLKINETPP